MVDISLTPLYALASPVIKNFQWSASNTTAVPAASTSLASPPPQSTVNITAGSGVTSLVAQVQASIDNSTNWTTIATVNLTAPGSASVVVGIPYLGLRVNVTTLAGGTASATLVEGQAPLAASGGTVLTSPQLTGIPQPGASLVSQWGVPVIVPSSGSIGNNGALTGITALPTTFANCWMSFPTNAIFAGSAAGVYFVQMSSTTAGTIFNNTLSSGAPYIPASPTPFVTTGPGAYAQSTSAQDLVSIPILGGSMGANGAIKHKAAWLTPNNAASKQTQVKFGGAVAATYSPASQNWLGVERTLRNMGVTNQQIVIAAATSVSSDVGALGAAASFLSVNTANNQNLVFSGLISAATDYIVLVGATVELIPSA
jgi:hypothetical protein